MDRKPRRARAASTTSETRRNLLVQAAPSVAVPATEAQNAFGRILDQAAAGQDVIITRHNVERAVLVSAERYRRLVAHGETPKTAALDALAAQLDDLYAELQTSAIREANRQALRITPEEIGRAAVAAAQGVSAPR